MAGKRKKAYTTISCKYLKGLGEDAPKPIQRGVVIHLMNKTGYELTTHDS